MGCHVVGLHLQVLPGLQKKNQRGLLLRLVLLVALLRRWRQLRRRRPSPLMPTRYLPRSAVGSTVAEQRKDQTPDRNVGYYYRGEKTEHGR